MIYMAMVTERGSSIAEFVREQDYINFEYSDQQDDWGKMLAVNILKYGCE